LTHSGLQLNLTMKSILFLALVLVASSSAVPKQKITSAKHYKDALTKGLVSNFFKLFQILSFIF
jgi:hypothetical protein